MHIPASVPRRERTRGCSELRWRAASFSSRARRALPVRMRWSSLRWVISRRERYWLCVRRKKGHLTDKSLPQMCADYSVSTV